MKFLRKVCTLPYGTMSSWAGNDWSVGFKFSRPTIRLEPFSFSDNSRKCFAGSWSDRREESKSWSTGVWRTGVR